MSGPAADPARTRSPSWAWAAADLALCVAATAVALWSFAPFYSDDGWVLTVAIALVVGTAVGVGTGLLRWSAGVATLAATVLFVPLAVYLLVPGLTQVGLPGVPALSGAADTIAGGLKRMLTVVPPVEPDGQVVALPVLLAYAGGFATALLVRRPAALAPLLPSLVTLLTGLLLTAGVLTPRWPVTLAYLAAALTVLLLRADRSDPALPPGATVAGAADAQPGTRAERVWTHSRAGRLVLGLPVTAAVGAVAVVGAALAPVANGAARFDPRDHYTGPVELDARISPLSDVRRQQDGRRHSPYDVFTVEVRPRGTGVDRLRVAALDRYDGALWTSSARFVRTGPVLPARNVVGDVVHLDVTITGLEPPYLPHAGAPFAVDGDDVAVDAGSGLLVTTAEPFRGYTYTVDATVPAPSTLAALATTGPARVPPGDPLLLVPAPPDLPPADDGTPAPTLAGLATELTAAVPEPWAQLEALATYLRTLPADLNALPGHSYAALQRVATGGGRVTDEQTAAAFVVMARSLGYPARVATGYMLDESERDGDVYTVTTLRAAAWPEVATDDAGWVHFDVTGERATAPEEPEPETGDQEETTADETAPRVDAQPGDEGPRGLLGGLVERVLPWALGLLALVPAVLAGVVVAKWWRRRRRRLSGAPADRVVAAWHETTDRFRERGLDVSPVRTTEEVAADAADRFGGPAGTAVAVLAPLVSTAVFAQDEPEDAAAEQAWDLEAELRQLLDADRSWWHRARAWLDPRPLLPHRVPRYGDRDWHRDRGGPS